VPSSGQKTKKHLRRFGQVLRMASTNRAAHHGPLVSGR
jgi:hypothetical protein